MKKRKKKDTNKGESECKFKSVTECLSVSCFVRTENEIFDLPYDGLASSDGTILCNIARWHGRKSNVYNTKVVVVVV